MPSFYPPTLPRQLPLTPPDYAPYPNQVASYSSDAGYGLDSRYHGDAFDGYGFSKPSHMPTAPPHEMYSHSHPAPSYPLSHARRDNGFGTIGAPILPPIRIPENTDLNQSYHSLAAPQGPAQEPAKEEKVAGGVAAHLDYEMEQMVDFVAEMASGMYDLYLSKFCIADVDLTRSVLSTPNVSPAFRKYVSQILTSTRLPSSTVLLALHYLGTRMTMLSSSGIFTSSNGHLYHMLTTSLMLASKFLDDNTFQNRSWAEVSHIAVEDLNKHEMDWLVEIKWNLHIDSNDPQGLSGWIKRWERWQAKKVEMSLEALKITPVDTSLRMQYAGSKYNNNMHNMPPTPVYTPTYTENMYSIDGKDRTSPHWQNWPSVRALSPPSAGHSGPNTPDWFGKRATSGYGQTPLSAAAPWSSTSSFGPLPPLRSSANSPYYAPYSSQPYTPIWGHGAGCGCGYCQLPHDRYGMFQPYGVQSVAG